MGKFACLAVLVAAVLFGSVTVAEAALPIKAVRTLGPRAVVMVRNVGNGISNFLWSNKGTITTGVVLATFASEPEPFVQGATTVVTATAEKTIETVVPAVAETVTTTASVGLLEYLILAGLGAVCTVAVYLAIRKVQWRRHAVPIAIFLVVFLVICCCGIAVRADTIGVSNEMICGVYSVHWGKLIWNIILFLLAFPLPG